MWRNINKKSSKWLILVILQLSQKTAEILTAYEFSHIHNYVFIKCCMNTPCFCLLLYFFRITKSDGKIVKSKSRTSVRRWIHCSGRSPSHSDFCSAVDVIVMYHLELIFVVVSGILEAWWMQPISDLNAEKHLWLD